MHTQNSLSLDEPLPEQLGQLIALFNVGKFKDVLFEVEHLIQMFPNSVELFNIQGACNASLGRYVEAIESYEEAIRIKPDHAEAYNNKGFSHSNRGEFDAAVDCHRQAIKLNPNYGEAYLNLGVALNNKQDIWGAIESYRLALKIRPDYAEAYFNLAMCLNVQGDLKKAIINYKSAIKFRPEYFEAHFNLGIALNNIGDFETAINVYRQAIKLSPHNAEVKYCLGKTLRNIGDLDGAVKNYKSAVKLNPKYVEALLDLGRTFLNKSDLDSAIKSYKQATLIKPDYAEAHYFIGNAIGTKYYRNLSPNNSENLLAAIESYKMTLKIEPNHYDAYEGLSFWLRHYIWALNNGSINNVLKIDELVKVEREKLLEKIKLYPLWFIDITRTSSTAIKVALGAKFGWPFGQNYYSDTSKKIVVDLLRSLLIPSHTPAFIVKNILGDDLWEKMETFAVVRNPYSWCSSLWHHSKKNNSLGLQNNTFDQFLDSIEEKLADHFIERPIFPSNYRQVDYLKGTEGEIQVKNMLRFEDKKSIDHFLNSVGVSGYSIAPRFVETKSSDYYISETEKKKVDRIFAEDFEALGY
jgi:tetratricopeptide (TPR) repeat protein